MLLLLFNDDFIDTRLNEQRSVQLQVNLLNKLSCELQAISLYRGFRLFKMIEDRITTKSYVTGRKTAKSNVAV